MNVKIDLYAHLNDKRNVIQNIAPAIIIFLGFPLIGLSSFDHSYQLFFNLIYLNSFSIMKVFLIFSAFYGAGALLFHILPCRREIKSISLCEFTFCSVLLGMFLISQLLFFLGLLNLLFKELLWGVNIIFTILGIFYFIYSYKKVFSTNSPLTIKRNFNLTQFILNLLLSYAIIVLLFRTISTVQIAWDAGQYHFGLPMWYLKEHGIRFYETIMHSGTYLGSELFYLFLLNPGFPEEVFGAKLLNICFALFLPASIFFCSKRIGLKNQFALFAILLMLSVQAIERIGGGKNDILAAGLCVATLWIFLIYQQTGSSAWVPLLGLVFGYSCSVKISCLILGPIILVMFIRMENMNKVKDFLFFCGFGLIPILPWAINAWIYRGTPFYPVHRYLPDYARQGLRVRGHNGLYLSFSNYFKYITPLILSKPFNGLPNKYDAALGCVFLFSTIGGSVGLLIRQVRKHQFIYLSGLFIFVVFSIVRFEGPFLGRYILAVPALIFIFLSIILQHFSKFNKPLFNAIIITISFACLYIGPIHGFAHSIQTDKNTLEFLKQNITKKELLTRTLPPRYLEMIQYINAHVKTDEKVMLNNAWIYYLEVPFIGISANSSSYIRYDKVGLDDFAAIMLRENVSAALIWRNTTGFYPVVSQYLEAYMSLVMKAGSIELYKRNSIKPLKIATN